MDAIVSPDMAKSTYRYAPAPIAHMPPGIPYIIANEAAERYSFYGMRAILVVFMTQYLMGATGELDVMSEGDAKTWFHTLCIGCVFLSDPRCDYRRRIPREIQNDPLVVGGVLPWSFRVGDGRDAQRASARFGVDRDRGRRHQALRFRPRRRSIWS